ncbi:hypothetical protein EVAR_74857_1 [Eumeta japonica]|uniref:Uncharacterized protein n=1 Tax=Eumeta variegata TaxID=151549 RepID=A0A4C1SSE3_EUMVA|nr:hypothetical protein EVAR_74857_1 [Eumeta japonica]
MRVGATSWRKSNHPTKRFGQLPKRSKPRDIPLYPHSKPDNSVAIDDAEIAECLADSIETQCSRFPPHDIAHISRIEEEQVLRLVEYVSEGFETERSTVAVFFDVAKAFDRQTDISHLGMSALTRQDVLSEQEFLKAPPSPLLYSAYTNDVPRPSSSGVQLALFADDTALFTEIGIGAPDSPSSPPEGH